MPTALFLESGEKSELKCEIEINPQVAAPKRIVWVKKGEITLPTGMIDDGNGTLSMSSASIEMSGEYICEVEGQNVTASGTALINVLHKVTVDYYITIDPQRLELDEGKVGQLTCQIETPPGAPEPGIKWLWNGSENLPYGTFDNRRGSLKFRDAKAQQSGTYICKTDTESLSKAKAIVSIKASQGRQLALFSKKIFIFIRMPQKQI